MAKRKRTANRQLVVEQSEPGPAPAPAPASGNLVALIALLIIIAIAAFIRMRLLNLPLERDEGEYAYAGQLMLHGVPPYTLAYNMKFPGTYAAYALIMSLFGETPFAIHVGLLLLTTATTILVYLLGAKLFDRSGAVVAAATYALLSISLQSMGPFAHAMHFVAFFAVAGCLLILSDSPRAVIAAGALLAIGVLMKQPGAAFALFAFIYLLVRSRRNAAMLAIGGASVAVVTVIALAAAGVLGAFKHWTIDYAREYATSQPWDEAMEQFRTNAGAIYNASPLVWLIVIGGAVMLFIDRKHLAFLGGFALASVLAVIPGFYFRPHYFLVMFPAAALLCGFAVVSLSARIAKRTPSPFPRMLPLIAFVAASLAALGSQWHWLAGMPPLETMHAVYPENPFIEAPSVGDYLREHTQPEERIAILGSEPEIYFYATRKSATGYIYAYPLMEPQRYAHEMQLDMIRGIEAAKPRYLLMVSHTYSWLAKKDSDRTIFDWYTKAAMSGAYELEAQVDDGNWITGAEARTYRPRTKNVIAIWRRK